MPALDEFDDALGEPSGRCAIDNVVVELQSETEVFMEFQTAIDQGGLLRDAPDDDPECVARSANSPPTSRAKHADRSQGDGAPDLL